MSVVGPLESMHFHATLHREIKEVVSRALEKKGVVYDLSELPPTPFEVYSKISFRMAEPTKIRIWYVEPYLVLLDGERIELLVQVPRTIIGNLFPRARKVLIPVKAKFILHCLEREMERKLPLYTQDVAEAPKEITIDELMVYIRAPMFWNRWTSEFRRQDFWVEFRSFIRGS